MTKRNKKLAAEFQEMDCIICGSPHQVTGDHIIKFARTKMRDQEFNVWPLCAEHHQEKDNELYLKRFVEKHNMSSELLSRGYYVCKSSKTWKHTLLHQNVLTIEYEDN